jgi:hypothetical protein
MQHLPKRLLRCVLNGEFLTEGKEYFSFLDLEGNRKDYCSQCWPKCENKGEGHFWKGKIPLKKEKKSSPDERAFKMFQKVQDPKKRFVLALYLQRKQQLVRRSQTLYECPETGELFDVAKVSFTPEEGEGLAKEIQRLINE